MCAALINRTQFSRGERNHYSFPDSVALCRSHIIWILPVPADFFEMWMQDEARRGNSCVDKTSSVQAVSKSICFFQSSPLHLSSCWQPCGVVGTDAEDFVPRATSQPCSLSYCRVCVLSNNVQKKKNHSKKKLLEFARVNSVVEIVINNLKCEAKKRYIGKWSVNFYNYANRRWC